MNDFLQLVASRQSDRAYDMSRAVEPEKLERILEAARLSPSACNAQPWRFVVITDPELSVKVGKATAGLGMNKFAKDAPIHILVVEESMNITSFLGAKIKDKYFPPDRYRYCYRPYHAGCRERGAGFVYLGLVR